MENGSVGRRSRWSATRAWSASRCSWAANTPSRGRGAERTAAPAPDVARDHRTSSTAAAAMQRLLLRYTQALITQMTQTAVCNRHHVLDQQLCRWLLLSLDRLPSTRARHDAGAHRQHARRAPRRGHRGRAAGCRPRASSSYRRGRISVLDRPRLEKRVCECYCVVPRSTTGCLPREVCGARRARLAAACRPPRWLAARGALIVHRLRALPAPLENLPRPLSGGCVRWQTVKP